MFAGNNEIITISHTATSREVFAAGAIRAALYVSDKGAGMYDMSNVINEK
jgi:4-hydroxy-tetrahydrodipicolinate reductase